MDEVPKEAEEGCNCFGRSIESRRPETSKGSDHAYHIERPESGPHGHQTGDSDF